MISEEFDIHSIKKIKGDLFELKKVNKALVIRYREDCQNHITRIDQTIEECEYKKKAYEDKIKMVNKLLAREE